MLLVNSMIVFNFFMVVVIFGFSVVIWCSICVCLFGCSCGSDWLVVR